MALKMRGIYEKMRGMNIKHIIYYTFTHSKKKLINLIISRFMSL